MFRFGSWFLFSCHILKLFSSFSRSTLNSEIMLSWLPFARIINDKAILSFALATIFCNFSWLSTVKKITNTRIWHFSDFSRGRCAMTLYWNSIYVNISEWSIIATELCREVTYRVFRYSVSAKSWLLEQCNFSLYKIDSDGRQITN